MSSIHTLSGSHVPTCAAAYTLNDADDGAVFECIVNVNEKKKVF